jgi:outer membrane murein-binding lipoprotein Lpp
MKKLTVLMLVLVVMATLVVSGCVQTTTVNNAEDASDTLNDVNDDVNNILSDLSDMNDDITG